MNAISNRSKIARLLFKYFESGPYSCIAYQMPNNRESKPSKNEANMPQLLLWSRRLSCSWNVRRNVHLRCLFIFISGVSMTSCKFIFLSPRSPSPICFWILAIQAFCSLEFGFLLALPYMLIDFLLVNLETKRW